MVVVILKEPLLKFFNPYNCLFFQVCTWQAKCVLKHQTDESMGNLETQLNSTHFQLTIMVNQVSQTLPLAIGSVKIIDVLAR